MKFTWYQKVLQIGIDDSLSKLERKRVKLLNIFWSNWMAINVLLMIDDIVRQTNPIPSLIGNTITFIFLFSICFFQYKQQFITARVLFITVMFYSNFFFSNFFEPGNQIEFYYLMIPPFLLLFTDNKKLLYGILLLCFLLFAIPKVVLDIYPKENQGSNVSMMVLFFVLFFLVNYFKQENLKNEKILEESKNQLSRLNKEQSQFFINVSHEIRTPLTLLKGQINKLKKIDNSQLTEIEHQLNYQTEKIKKIVDDVIDLAKMKTANFKLHLEEIDINQIIQRLYLSFEPLFKQKKIQFRVDNQTQNSHTILADAIFLERAFNNILSNALKYTDKNGSVTIEIKENAQSFIVSFKDNGIGISKENITRVFDRFYQEDNHINKSGGSGVGLAFSKEIIIKLNGVITVESMLYNGTVFKVILPKESLISNVVSNIELVKKTKTVLKSVKKLASENKKNLLIVDDSFEMRNYLKEILIAYNCYEAADGLEALKIIKTKKIDVVVTDYMMPKMDGLELVKSLREIQFDAPILMLTAITENQVKIDVLRLAIDDYLNKPFEEEELIIRIENALRNHQKRTKFRLEENISITEINHSEDWLQEVKEYIFEQCGKNKLTQIEISNYFALSSSSLYRKIKTETGLTPNEFIKEVKLQKARMLLENNQILSLKQLVLEVGFKHTSYFSKMYYARFGTKPICDS